MDFIKKNLFFVVLIGVVVVVDGAALTYRGMKTAGMKFECRGGEFMWLDVVFCDPEDTTTIKGLGRIGEACTIDFIEHMNERGKRQWGKKFEKFKRKYPRTRRSWLKFGCKWIPRQGKSKSLFCPIPK